jgi:hypothetical protein
MFHKLDIRRRLLRLPGMVLVALVLVALVLVALVLFPRYS